MKKNTAIATQKAPMYQMDATPDAMHVRGRTVEHVFATLKHWMGGWTDDPPSPQPAPGLTPTVARSRP